MAMFDKCFSNDVCGSEVTAPNKIISDLQASSIYRWLFG